MTEQNKAPETTAASSSSTINIGGNDTAVIDIRDSKFAGRDLIERYVEQEIIVKIDSLEDVPPLPGDPPYKGLTYFTEADADLFFGREDLIARLLARLTDDRFLAIIGASGSGKSSLLRAGVIPRLRAKNWQIHTFTPTAHPLSALANTLARDEPLGTASTLTNQFSADAQTLLQVSGQLAARQTSDRVLIFVDQFEELFTLCADEVERQAFLDNLMTAASAESTATVIISMRADFYARCDRYEQLRQAVASNQEYVGPMNQVELIRAIVEPARRNGWRFVDGLVEQIVDDVRDEPGRLPLLSHALLETWRGRKGNVMTLSGYRAVGGVEGAIAKSAETTYTTLNDTQKRIAQRVFLSLTEINDNAVETRRRATRDELLADVGHAADVEQVLDRLARARLITVDEDDVEVAHEALIREWPSLHTWLEENREALLLRRRLLRAATEWDSNNRDAGFLYRGARLAETQEWCAANPGEHLTPVERDFLDESNAAQAREREAELEAERQAAQLEAERRSARRLRLLRNGLAVVAVLMIIAAVWALIGQIQASRARDTAFLAQESAESSEATAVVAQQTAEAGEAEIAELNRQIQAQRLAIAADKFRGIDPELALSLGEAAVNATFQDDGTTYVPDARAALYQALHPPQLAAPVATLHGHTDTVKSAEFSADGSRLLTASTDGTARIWDVATSETLATLPGHNFGVSSAEFNPDSTRIVTTADGQGAWLWDGVTGERIAALLGNQESSDIYLAPEFSPDGSRLLTAGLDGNATLWDGVSGALIAELDPPAHLSTGYNQIRFSTDGSRFALAAADEVVTLHDSSNGEQIAAIEACLALCRVAFVDDLLVISGLQTDGDMGFSAWDARSGQSRTLPTNWQTDLAFAFAHDGAGSADGSRLVTIARDYADVQEIEIQELAPDDNKTAWLWNTTSANWIRNKSDSNTLTELVGHGDQISGSRFSDNGALLVTYSQDNTARLWDGKTGASLGTLIGHTNNVRSADFNPAGTLLATVGDTTVRLWDVFSGSLQTTLNTHDNAVHSVEFARTGDHFVTGGNRVWLWDDADAPRGTQIDINQDGLSETNRRPPAAIVINNDGSRLFTVSQTGAVGVLWDGAGNLIRITEPTAPGLTTALFSPDGKRLIGVDRFTGYTGVYIWDGTTGDHIADIDVTASTVAFSPDSMLLATDDADHSIQLWAASDGTPVRQFDGHTNTINAIQFSPDSTRLISVGNDKMARLYDVASGELIHSLEGHEDDVIVATFSRDGSRVVTGGLRGNVRLWDSNTGELVAALDGAERDVIALRFSPDNTLLLVATRDATPQLVHAATGEFVTDLPGHTADLKSAEFSPDGNWIITTSDDTTARLWDGHTGEPIAVLEGHTDWVNAASFRPDSQFVATASDDGTVKVWRLFSAEIDDLLGEAAGRIRRDFSDIECRNYSLENTPTCNR
ncbi:MAG: hypothetical protein M9928_15110 [Anaerolineae bacterium]|nr:hypothetical protein [Anaerolineae bacterium]